MAPGYDHETLKEGLTEGRTAYVVFDSQTTGEQLYFYYQPVGVNDWRIALSVPESVAFSSAREIQSLFRVFLAFEAICFFLYFLWMVFYVRSVTDEKQRQLDTIHHIYDVEKLLFNAHENRENLSQALEKISGIIGANG